MITREFPLDIQLQYPLEQRYDISQLVFFDIETTGLSADTSYLYLIGCVYYKNSQFHMVQWFSEGIQEETLLLHAFFSFVHEYRFILHFNGSSFDIPYLLKKCNHHKLTYHFDQFQMIDLYKKTLSLKKILKLPNYRQKTLEDFLNIPRKDTFGGGDLIEVYQGYLGKKLYENLRRKTHPNEVSDTSSESDLMLGSLLLHNEDDLKGLVALCTLFAYEDLFFTPLDLTQVYVEHSRLHIHGNLIQAIPTPIDYHTDLIHLHGESNFLHLQIQLYEGELKHFYENYKDYYYLPAEDRAIHQSVAQFVEKEYKKKAKASNAYTRKSGVFVPQLSLKQSPYYKISHKDTTSFLEVHTDFLLQEDHLKTYVSGLLEYLFIAK